MTGCAYSTLTPTSAVGAIAAIQIDAPSPADADAIIDRLGLAPLPVGDVALRDLGSVDTALVARPAGASIVLTPHASPLIVRALVGWLERHDIRRAPRRPLYPEAPSALEHAMLETLAIAASPLAIDAILRQPDLWRDGAPPPDAAHDATLNRLLAPPLVVGVGHANVGKSTLVNALAQRQVSIVADAPGTTRDHVGVTLDLAGLVIRWVDTPGVPRSGPADALESDAIAGASDAIRDADLIVSCADASTPFLDPDAIPAGPATPVVRCATRADLDPTRHAHPDADLTTAAAPPGAPPAGLERLATTVRDRLVPPDSLAAPIPWRFHPSLGHARSG